MLSPREFFERLLSTPGPSGYEQPVQALVRQRLVEFADEVRTDRHGNVIGSIRPLATPRLMFDGHCDQIGLLVSHIDDQGFLYSQAIGGWDNQQLVGQRMVVWTAGGPVPGVISRKAIHLMEDDERKQVPKTQDLWIDIGARSRDEALEQVRIGDPVTLELGHRDLRNGRLCGPAMDNRAGLWVVIEAARRASERSTTCGLFVVSSVQEEIGLRGVQTAAHSVHPQVGIAVDVTHATDCPTIDRRERGLITLGGGPVIFRGANMNPVVSERLLSIATERRLPHQLAAFSRGAPNNANTLQLSRDGVATGLVSVPLRYMHSAVETLCWDDLDNAAELLAAFAVSLSEEDTFIPA